MSIFKPHPESLASLIDTVKAHEHALALWGFLEISHQQRYGNASVLSPALQAIVEASRQDVESVLAISRWLGDMVEEVAASYFGEEEGAEDDPYEVIAWARGQLELDPEIGERLWDFKVAQLLLEQARERGYN
jgi:hypothetical protein